MGLFTSQKFRFQRFFSFFLFLFTSRNEVVAKVMFLLMSVILLTGAGAVSEADPPRADTPGADTPHPPGADTPPPQQTPPQSRPPRADTPPQEQTPPTGSRLRHTIYERPVRILLECILVLLFFLLFQTISNHFHFLPRTQVASTFCAINDISSCMEEHPPSVYVTND